MGASQCCDQSQGQAVVSSVSSEGPHPSRGLGGARPRVVAAFSAVLLVVGSPKPPGDGKLSYSRLFYTQSLPRQHQAGMWARLRGGRKRQDSRDSPSTGFPLRSGEVGREAVGHSLILTDLLVPGLS